MPIPESQLTTWSKQGAITTAKSTHESIERVLRRHGPSVDYEVYLQGSYRNSTNIYGDSDVDVVAQLKSTFLPDLSALDSNQQAAFHRAHPGSAAYQWQDFRRDVLAALVAGFGSAAVTEGSKCLKVVGSNGRLPCDVVPCMQYQYYTSFTGVGPGSFVPGIIFWSRPDQRRIVNFPKPHYDNGVAKHQNTSKWFKPVVRMLKNARNAAVGKGYLADGTAPSYFEECFVYNAPATVFGGSYRNSFCNVLNWWANNDLSHLLCQNEVTLLFGNTPEQWSETSAKQLITGLTSLWNNWS